MASSILQKIRKKIPNLSATVFLLAILIHCLFNTVDLIKQAQKNSQYRHAVPYQFSGDKFKGLEQIFKDVAFVGYFTNRDINDPQSNLQFSQAQFTLAPTILDNKNYAAHEYIIFDCSPLTACVEIMKELNAYPFKSSPHGIILTRKAP